MGATSLHDAAFCHTHRFPSVIVEVSDIVLAIPHKCHRHALAGTCLINHGIGISCLSGIIYIRFDYERISLIPIYSLTGQTHAIPKAIYGIGIISFGYINPTDYVNFPTVLY